MNIFDKVESLHWNAALAITGVISGSWKEKLYQELCFEYLSSRRWLRKHCLFYKIVVNKSSNRLYNYVSTVNQSYQNRNGDKFCTQSKNGIIIVLKFVNQYCISFLEIHNWNL